MLATETDNRLIVLEDGSTLILFENEHVLQSGTGSVAVNAADPALFPGDPSPTVGTAVAQVDGVEPVVSSHVNAPVSTSSASSSGIDPMVSSEATTSPALGMVTSSGIGPAMSSEATTSPALGMVTSSGVNPSVSTITTVAPMVSVVAGTGIDPSLSTGSAIVPSSASLTSSGIAPSVTTGPTSTSPFVGTAAVTGVDAASVRAPLTPGIASVSVAGVAPSVVSGPSSVQAGIAIGVSSGLSPDLIAVTKLAASVPSAVVSGRNPEVHQSIKCGSNSAVGSGINPTVAIADVVLTASHGGAAASGIEVSRVAEKTFTPDVAGFVSSGNTPEVSASATVRPSSGDVQCSGIDAQVTTSSVVLTASSGIARTKGVNTTLQAVKTLAASVAIAVSTGIDCTSYAETSQSPQTCSVRVDGTGLSISSGDVAISVGSRDTHIRGIDPSPLSTVRVELENVGQVTTSGTNPAIRSSPTPSRVWTVQPLPTEWRKPTSDLTWVSEPRHLTWKVESGETMATEVLTKQPGESLVFAFDFSQLLSQIGTTLASVTSVSALPTGLTITGQQVNSTLTGITFRVSGGVSGQVYKVTCVVVTQSGDTLEEDGKLYVRNS